MAAGSVLRATPSGAPRPFARPRPPRAPGLSSSRRGRTGCPPPAALLSSDVALLKRFLRPSVGWAASRRRGRGPGHFPGRGALGGRGTAAHPRPRAHPALRPSRRPRLGARRAAGARGPTSPTRSLSRQTSFSPPGDRRATVFPGNPLVAQGLGLPAFGSALALDSLSWVLPPSHRPPSVTLRCY